MRRLSMTLGPPKFSKPRDTINWGRDQTRFPARIFDTIRPSGKIIYLILLIKYEKGIEFFQGKTENVSIYFLDCELSFLSLYLSFLCLCGNERLRIMIKFFHL